MSGPSPSELYTQLFSSIPSKTLAAVRDWKVKQVVITKMASTADGDAPSHHGIHVTTPAANGGPPMLRKLSKMGTSKLHKFKPSVSLEQALTWLSEYGLADSTVLFDNNCSFLFEKAAFLEFEDIRDDEDEDD